MWPLRVWREPTKRVTDTRGHIPPLSPRLPRLSHSVRPEGSGGPDCYQRLEFFIQVLRVLCPNLTDASLVVGHFPRPSLSVTLVVSSLRSSPSIRRERERNERVTDGPTREGHRLSRYAFHPAPLRGVRRGERMVSEETGRWTDMKVPSESFCRSS